MHYILQDWNVNSNNPKARFVLLFLRTVQYIGFKKTLKFIYLPLKFIYRFFVDWIMCIDIPINTKIGHNCKIYHGQGLVINSDAVIGNNCVLRNTTTIGNKMNLDRTYSGSPVIGNNCDIGVNVVIIGEINIGDNVTIGAGTILTKSIPNDTIVYGNPNRIKNK